MTKKSKRQAPRQYSSLATKGTEFNPDYSITKHDLKRIGILAASFFGVLIVLAIFQNQILSLFVK